MHLLPHRTAAFPGGGPGWDCGPKARSVPADPRNPYVYAHTTHNLLKLVQRAEELGYDSVWSAEAYGSDAVTPLAFLAGLTKRIKLGTGIMQLAARTPANAAMCAGTRGG